MTNRHTERKRERQKSPTPYKSFLPLPQRTREQRLDPMRTEVSPEDHNSESISRGSLIAANFSSFTTVIKVSNTHSKGHSSDRWRQGDGCQGLQRVGLISAGSGPHVTSAHRCYGLEGKDPIWDLSKRNRQQY